MEPFVSLAFMIFSLGFFTWTMRDVQRTSDKDREHTLNTAREFGYENSKLRKEGIIHRPRK